MTLVLVDGLEENDVNFRGEFDFTVDKGIKLLWKNERIEISDLKVGQRVSITANGEILERYPAGLTKVSKVVLLEEE